MRKFKKAFSIILSSVLLLFLSCCASNNVSVDEKLDSANAQPNNRKVCKSYLPTNSRIPIKDCRSAGEWAEVERTAQDRLDNMTKPQTNNPQGQ